MEKVLAGGLADMVFTDPPYNVNYGATMGEALLYQAGGAVGTPSALTGVWTEDTGVQASRPGAQASVYLCLPDMPADPAKGDVVVHNGITYFVMEATFDGHGSARLFLRKP